MVLEALQVCGSGMRDKMHIRATRRYEREEGQGLVEFAIGLVVLILILSGVADLGRAYFTYVALSNAAGEGALYASFAPSCPNATAGTACAIPNNVDYRVRNESPSGVIDTSQITSVTVQTPNPDLPELGDPITVTLVYEYEFITPLFRSIGADSIDLHAEAVQPVRSQ